MYSHPCFVVMCLGCLYLWEYRYSGWGALVARYWFGDVGNFLPCLLFLKTM